MHPLKSIASGLKPGLRHVCFFLALCASALATIIQPDTATASSFFSSDYRPENTINGSGLLGPVATLPNHAPYSNAGTGNHWTTDGSGPLNEWIQWGFASDQTLDTIYLWNHQSTQPLSNNTGYDVTAFSLTFLDSSLATIGTFSGTLAVDSAAAQTFAFGALSGVRFVKLDVDGTQFSTNYTGLAEVAFNTATLGVPDNATTAALLGLSALGLGLFSRRRSLA
jgi:hypothetical protein